LFKDTLEKLDKVWNYSMDIVGVLIRNMPDLTSAAIEGELFPLYAMKLTDYKNREDYEIVDATCIIDDVCEFGSQALYDKIAPEALAKFTEILYAKGAENQQITQCIIFGLGVIAQRTPASPEFKSSLEAICLAVKWVYSQNFTTDDGKRAMCTDNAIGAFGKCILFHGGQPNGEIFAEQIV